MAEPWPSHGRAMAEPWPSHGRAVAKPWLCVAEPWRGRGQTMAWPWPLSIHGGRDSGRLDFSVRTWPAEAATAADQTGGLGEGSPQQKPDLTLTCMKGHVLGSALSLDPDF